MNEAEAKALVSLNKAVMGLTRRVMMLEERLLSQEQLSEHRSEVERTRESPQERETIAKLSAAFLCEIPTALALLESEIAELGEEIPQGE